MAQIELQDDSVDVVLAKDGEPQTFKLDILELRMLFEEIENHHKLDVVDGRLYATRSFLSDAASALEEIGLPGVTPSMAFQLWLKLGSLLEGLKKNTNAEQK